MRNFNKDKYKEMRKYLPNINWNILLKKTKATKRWAGLKNEIEGITKRFIPLKKQGKRSKKKHRSNGVIRKIAHKQMLWMVNNKLEMYKTIQTTKRHLT